MALEIFWSKASDERFDEIISYLEVKWGDVATKTFVKRTHEILDLLSEYPEMGTIENESMNIRGFVIVKQITLFYQVRDNKLILLNFYDNRQKPTKRKVKQ